MFLVQIDISGTPAAHGSGSAAIKTADNTGPILENRLTIFFLLPLLLLLPNPSALQLSSPSFLSVHSSSTRFLSFCSSYPGAAQFVSRSILIKLF